MEIHARDTADHDPRDTSFIAHRKPSYRLKMDQAKVGMNSEEQSSQ